MDSALLLPWGGPAGARECQY